MVVLGAPKRRKAENNERDARHRHVVRRARAMGPTRAKVQKVFAAPLQIRGKLSGWSFEEPAVPATVRPTGGASRNARAASTPNPNVTRRATGACPAATSAGSTWWWDSCSRSPTTRFPVWPSGTGRDGGRAAESSPGIAQPGRTSPRWSNRGSRPSGSAMPKLLRHRCSRLRWKHLQRVAYHGAGQDRRAVSVRHDVLWRQRPVRNRRHPLVHRQRGR